MRDRVAELHRLQLQRDALVKQRSAEREALEQQVARLQRDVASRRLTVERLREQADALSAEVADLNEQSNYARQQLREMGQATLALLQKMRARLDQATPSLRSMSPQLDRMIAGLSAEDAGSDATPIVQAHQWLTELLPRHRARVLENRLVAPAGDVPAEQAALAYHAYVLRLGSVVELFISEDGKHVGVASRETKNAWHTQLADDGWESVRMIIGIVRKQQPAKVTPTPVVVPRDTGSSN